MYINRQISQVWPWTEETRFDAFGIASDMAEILRHTDVYGNEVASIMTDSFEGFPLLVLTDRDGDGRADFFAYHDDRREETTLEFGAYYSEPGNVMPYWLVFNRGPGFTRNEDGDPVLYWTNYQFVDRNQDGRFDAYAVNDLDYDGDGNGSATDVLWLYDDDFDGGLDRGEHIVDRVPHEVPIFDDVLQTRRLAEESVGHQFHVGDPIDELADIIANDIRQALAEGERPVNQPPIPYFSGDLYPEEVDNPEGWQERQVGGLRLQLPAGDEWEVEFGEGVLQVFGGRRFDDTGALLTADAIAVVRDVIAGPIFGDWVEEELAIRDLEWEAGNMLGNASGDQGYSLGNLQMGDAQIAGNSFYFLRHFHLYDPPLQNGVRRIRQELHLVFSPDFAETHVFYRIYLNRYCVQEQCDNEDLDVSYLRQALGHVSF